MQQQTTPQQIIEHKIKEIQMNEALFYDIALRMLEVKFQATQLQGTNGKEDEDTRLRELQNSDKALEASLVNCLINLDQAKLNLLQYFDLLESKVLR